MPIDADSPTLPSTPHSPAVHNVKAPPFCTDRSALWFVQSETQFYLHNVTAQRDKFSLAVAHIATHHAAEIEDIITSPPPDTAYTTLQASLIERFSKSKEAKLQQLLQGECIGDRSPSTFLRHLKSLVPSIDQDVLRAKWCSALPEQTRVLLTTQSGTSLDQQAALADKLHELNLKPTAHSSVHAIVATQPTSIEARLNELSAQVSALAKSFNGKTTFNDKINYNTRRSRSRSGIHTDSRRNTSSQRPRFDSSGVCFYHYTFKANARKCVPGCTYQGNQNESH